MSICSIHNESFPFGASPRFGELQRHMQRRFLRTSACLTPSAKLVYSAAYMKLKSALCRGKKIGWSTLT